MDEHQNNVLLDFMTFFLQTTVCFFVLNCSWQIFFYKQCKHVCKHCDHCDHWRQQNQPESKTREKVTLDSLDSFRRWGFFPLIYLFIYLWSSDIFSFSLCASFCHQHNGNLCFATLKTSLFSWRLRHHPPSRYLCISASRLSPPRGWKALPSLVNPPPFSKCTKGFLSACLHSGAEGVLSQVQK